ncbi:hypothetical protein Rhe02_57670 [Rhizocola hellebori]|uniref:Uncharacterized protein n=1 Tax=Rhizocola hellebori TaxID=1392758 RepID=A0A8J3QDM8_9ACTN|nr:hypothetical protein Rhe02_57670 [Rhizocola hellebori]
MEKRRPATGVEAAVRPRAPPATAGRMVTVSAKRMAGRMSAGGKAKTVKGFAEAVAAGHRFWAA